MSHAITCNRCLGSGYIEACYSCHECDGTGIGFEDDDDTECCIHGVGWDEDCPDCNDYEDEADGLI